MTKIASLLFMLLTAPSSDSAFDEAALYLAGIEGIELEEGQNGDLKLRGEVERVGDLRRLKEFMNKYPEIKDELSLSPEAGLQIEKKLEKRLKIIAPEARLRRQGRFFSVVGTDSQTVVESLRKIYPLVSLEKIQKPSRLEPSIFLEIALIEVKKSALSKLGTRISSPIGVSSDFGLQFLQNAGARASLTSDPIRAFLDLAMQQGEARIHAKQSLVTQNGRRGDFMAGGEFPIKVVSGLIAKVEFKRFGLMLGFTPHLQSGGMVHLEIDSEMSDIDTGSLVDGIPVIVKKELKTQIFARLNEMMAIGGIVQNSQSKYTDSIPGLSAIPILGRLFESEDFKRHKSEAYIFITPRQMTQPWLPSPEL